MTSSNCDYFLRVPSSDTTVGVRTSPYEFGLGGDTIPVVASSDIGVILQFLLFEKSQRTHLLRCLYLRHSRKWEWLCKNAKIMQRFRFTGKGSLNFWNAYIVEYLNTCRSLSISTKNNSDPVKMFFYPDGIDFSELRNYSLVINIQLMC